MFLRVRKVHVFLKGDNEPVTLTSYPQGYIYIYIIISFRFYFLYWRVKKYIGGGGRIFRVVAKYKENIF